MVATRAVLLMVLALQPGHAALATDYQPPLSSETVETPHQPEKDDTSRQRIIDAAQVYCSEETPFDRVHALLDAFWQSPYRPNAGRENRCQIK